MNATTHRFSFNNVSELLVIKELIGWNTPYIYKSDKGCTEASAAKLAAKSKKKRRK